MQPTRKISLLLVCRSYPPIIGGSEIEAQRVCAGLLGRGHRVEVVCCGGDPMPKQQNWIDPYGVPVRMYGAGPGRWNDYRYAAGVVWTLLKERGHFDLVYFLMPGVHVAAGVPVARWSGSRSFMKFAGSSEIQKVVKATIGSIELAFLRNYCERIMVLNDGMVQEAVSAGFPRAQLMWMPNPVDTRLFSPCEPARKVELRKLAGIPAESAVAVFVGRLAPEKELPSLVAGFAIAVGGDPSARLVVVGDGPMRKQLEDQVATLGLQDHVRFAGMQSTAEIAQWLQLSDVFTLVSSREGLPVSLIEAMSVGLPSVVTDLPATRQLIVEGEHGFHVPVHDEKAIGTALLKLFHDPQMRQRFGVAARPIAVKQFSMDTVLDAYERLFAEILH